MSTALPEMRPQPQYNPISSLSPPDAQTAKTQGSRLSACQPKGYEGMPKISEAATIAPDSTPKPTLVTTQTKPPEKIAAGSGMQQ